jgi:hypothetical protein
MVVTVAPIFSPERRLRCRKGARMRNLLPLLFFVAVGCNHCPRLFDCNSCARDGECKETADCGPKQRGPEVPCPKQPCEEARPPQKCEQAPEIEIRAPKPIHIKVPQQKIIVPEEVQPQAIQQPAMQPQSFTPQSFAPQSMAPQQMMMVPMAQSAGPAGRARPGLTLDFFRLPIPFPRLIAVPEAAPVMQAVAVMAPQSFAPQSFVPQSFAPQPAPQAFVPQAAPVQQHVMVPVPGTVDVPVQTTMKVPYQAHVPVPVPPQSFVPQSAPVQLTPQATTVQPQSSAPPSVICIPAQQAEEFYRLLEQLKKQTNQPQGAPQTQAPALAPPQAQAPALAPPQAQQALASAQAVAQAGRPPTPEEADEFYRQWNALKAKMQSGQH